MPLWCCAFLFVVVLCGVAFLVAVVQYGRALESLILGWYGVPWLTHTEVPAMKQDDILKVLKGAGIAALGAVLTYLTQWISGADFGPWTPTVVAVWSIVVNAARKWLSPSTVVKAVVAVLALQTGFAFAADPPAVKQKCSSCGDNCKCPDGFCPSRCAVSAKPAKIRYQQCVNGRCTVFEVDAGTPIPFGATVLSEAATSTTATPSCASGTCYTQPARSGWYPGKLLGRRR